jgi:hypothetical protein
MAVSADAVAVAHRSAWGSINSGWSGYGAGLVFEPEEQVELRSPGIVSRPVMF